MYQESKKCHNNQLIRSFGRIKSRKLSDHKNNLLDNSLPKYEILDDFFKKNYDFEKKSFEIGFGFGDFLYQKAKNNQNQLFLGCEPHINGVVSLLGYLEKEPLNNVKISLKDARLLLDERFNDFFDEFYILFPDPWPKSRHFKRRLINQEFLDNFIAKKLKKGAKLTIATDHDSYKTWILSAILKSEEFTWQCSSKSSWQNFPDDWVETKYQKKAAKEGRNSIIFQLFRK
jgi:tRNA (guanine-N7-)-methyltransferase